MIETTVEQLFVYPVKGLAGVSVSKLEFGSFGVKHDRQYLLVNQYHKMITQRSHPILSQFKLELQGDDWCVFGPKGNEFMLREIDSTESVFQTSVWKNNLQVREKSPQLSQWFSEQLDELVHLVELDDLERRIRTVDHHESPLAFADSFPLLVCNRQSLNQLNQELKSSLSMRRFRPNIVVSLPESLEYEINTLEVSGGGQLIFDKPCVRCNVPAINPDTSVFQPDVHSALKSALNRDGSVVFGMNAISVQLKSLKLGAQLSVQH